MVGYFLRDLLHRSTRLETQDAALTELAVRSADVPPLVMGATLRTECETGTPTRN
jgi:hypothetical protein